MTILFLDTEFTNFIKPELISIALVVLDSDDEFYTESTSYNGMLCSGFVQQTVLPLLDGGDTRGSSTEIAENLVEWLANHPRATITVDYNGDYVLMRSLLDKVDPKLQATFNWQYTNALLVKHSSNRITTGQTVPVRSVTEEYKIQEDHYFKNIDHRRHHALVDARAMKYAWQNTIKGKKK